MLKFLLFLIPLFFIACGSSSSTVDNVAPVANAGLFQYANTGSTFTLDGSGSSDADGDPLTYQWSFYSIPSGSMAVLLSADTVAPTFTTDLDGNYVIKLIVNDGKVDSAPAYVTVSTTTFVDPSTGAQAANEIYTPTSATMVQQPMIVIRLAFQNQTFVSSQAIWQQKHFGTQPGQLNDYYHEISHDQFEFVPVANDGNVTDGITTVTSFDNHPDPDINSLIFVQELHPTLKWAIEQVSAEGFDFSVYDTNHDNAITPDELIVTFIMAGEEDAYNGGSPANGVWAHQWCTDSTYTPTVNGVTVMGCAANGNYAIFGERHDAHSVDDPPHDATVGIIAHELGHSTFSLPDLYDTDSVYGGIGYYGLMGSGSWGQQGNVGEPGDTPTHMTAWSKIAVGWYSASSTSSDINADLPLYATGTPDYNIIKTPISGSTNEYFLAENRGANSYDAGLKLISNGYQGGVAIWHIDSTTISQNLLTNTVNAYTSHKGVDLEEANTPSLDSSYGDPTKNLYYSGNKTEFTPNTLPSTNLYNNSRSYIFFTDIPALSDAMSVRINNPL